MDRHGHVAISHHLHFDVPSRSDEPFCVQPTVAKSSLCFLGAGRIGLRRVFARLDPTHAPAAASGYGLNHERRVARQSGLERAHLVESGPASDTLDHRHFLLDGEGSSARLVAEQF